MLRFAPSPTGDMHISTLRVAILNYLVAQQKNDQFLVRIEDRESKRNIQGKDTEIMMLLEKFALKHEAVFHQTEHTNLYQTLAIRLLKEKKAFICKCSDEALNADNYSGHCEMLTTEDYEQLKASDEKFVIRVKKPTTNITYNDIIQGTITSTPDEVDAFVIVDEEGVPSYNFACATDDMMSNIDFIIREEKYLLETPKQIHIKNLLDYEEETQYAHLPTLISEEKKSSLKWLFEEGFIPDAILNYLLLLGNSKVSKETFTLPEAIQWFDLNNISTSPIKFDLEKLRSLNREHLKQIDDRELSTLFGFADAEIGKLAKLYLQECSTTNELEKKIRPIFTPKAFTSQWGEEMKIISNLIFEAPTFETLDELKTHITKKSGLEGKNLSKPLRHLLTGAKSGPELSEVYPLIKSYILEVAS